MKEQSGIKPELIEEISVLKQRIQELEQSISEHKQVEDALRESEEKYRLLIENSHDIIYMLTPDGVFTFVSPGWTTLLGHPVIQIVGKPFQQFVHPDDIGRFEIFLRRVIETGQRQTGFEYRVRHADGYWRWHTTNAVPLKDESGTIVGFEGIASDITERKRAEKALKESEQKLANIIEFLPDATFVIDKDKKVVAWNRAVEEMTGIKAEAILGKGNYEYALPFYGERRPILIDLVLKPREDIEAKYVSTERGDTVIAGEAYVPALRGREAYLFGTASILHDSRGMIVGAIESIRDITERKRTEDALRESEERFRALSENAPDIIYTMNHFGAITYVNPSWKRIMGHDTEEVLGRYFNDFAREEDRKTYRKLFKGIRDEGKSVNNYIGAMLTKDGKKRIFNMNSAFNRNSEGCITGVVGSMKDVTELREIEKKLSQAQKMEAIGTLSGGIAHDFNNILGAIMGYTEIALTAPNVDDRLQRYLNQIYIAGERATELVKQILAFSRQSDQNPRPLRVSPIIKEVLKFLRATLPVTITIRQDIQSDMDTVLADPTQIHQIMMNLCTNAGHAMRETKGELKVSLIPVEIKPGDSLIILHGLTPDVYLKLTVSDTGAGIHPEIMDRIFDPFFTTKNPGEGTGMGLSVVHGIIKSYHGAITVESAVGKGTDCHVYLPLLKESEEKREVEAAADITGGKECILFVDDEEMLVEIGKDMLTILGYEVIERTSSLEALKLFRFNPGRFDLVITDMTMPNMTGIELAQEIIRIRPGLPVILCTGFSEAITQEKAKAIGLKDFIMKPLIKNQIAAAIRRVLDQKEQG